ncbi:MAG: hypothetical protein JNJ93_00945 [Acinetobacter sp.]|nr:hypothetical protein [Acinetobacter sp.]
MMQFETALRLASRRIGLKWVLPSTMAYRVEQELHVMSRQQQQNQQQQNQQQQNQQQQQQQTQKNQKQQNQKQQNPDQQNQQHR